MRRRAPARTPSALLALLLAALPAALLAGCVDPVPGPAPPSPTPAAGPVATPSGTAAPDGTPPWAAPQRLEAGMCVAVHWQGGPLDGQSADGTDGADGADHSGANGSADLPHEGMAIFVLGSGRSGLGPEAEQALVGLALGESVDVESRDAAGRLPNETTLQRRFGPYAAEQPWDILEFRVQNPSFNLSAATPGQAVGQHPWRPYYNATYVAHNGTHVVLRYHPEDGRLHALNEYPIQLRTTVAADGSWSEAYVAQVGAAFQVPTAPGHSCRTDFHLTPGDYTVLAVREDDLLLRFEPSLPADLQGPARLRLSVLDHS